MSDYEDALRRLLNDGRKHNVVLSIPSTLPQPWRIRWQRATPEAMTLAEVEEYRRLVGHLWRDDGDIVEAVRQYTEPQPLVDEGWLLSQQNGKSLALMHEIMKRMWQGQYVEIIDPKGKP